MMSVKYTITFRIFSALFQKFPRIAFSCSNEGKPSSRSRKCGNWLGNREYNAEIAWKLCGLDRNYRNKKVWNFYVEKDVEFFFDEKK